jgi:hypothetical protein
VIGEQRIRVTQKWEPGSNGNCHRVWTQPRLLHFLDNLVDEEKLVSRDCFMRKGTPAHPFPSPATRYALSADGKRCLNEWRQRGDFVRVRPLPLCLIELQKRHSAGSEVDSEGGEEDTDADNEDGRPLYIPRQVVGETTLNGRVQYRVQWQHYTDLTWEYAAGRPFPRRNQTWYQPRIERPSHVPLTPSCSEMWLTSF